MTDSTLTNPTPSADSETLVIKPSHGLAALNLRDLWRYRELAFFLTWRDIKVRYKQTILGAAWAIIQPLLQMVIFNFLFGDLGNISTGDIPRPIFTYSALLVWNLFATALNDASRSLVSSRNMITRVYFPRLIIPLSSILSGLVDFFISFLVLLGMMFFYHLAPTAAIWTLPLFLVLALMTALGVGLWLSALNVNYRDVRYILPFLTQFWMLASPIAYPVSKVPEGFRLLYALNPMVGVVEGFRWALLGAGAGSESVAEGAQWILISAETGIDPVLWVSVGISLLILVSGLFYFRHMEKTFADMV
ncbi:MAG: ABC transporter permease [Anaerolineales bacterium]|nr:ABC transporter permease [Anaerolineales bacterium]